MKSIPDLLQMWWLAGMANCSVPVIGFTGGLCLVIARVETHHGRFYDTFQEAFEIAWVWNASPSR
ncbi:MAG: hypothetical protein VX641_01350, partial [Planctomycetota bacterium]|nr:hypothetical protein [Planctomycetota bacterium]